MPEQLTKELERLNSFAFKFTYLYEELSAYLSWLEVKYRLDGTENSEIDLDNAVNDIRCALLSITHELHLEFVEELFFQRSQPANN